jgi:hypothetical protein
VVPTRLGRPVALVRRSGRISVTIIKHEHNASDRS